MAAFGSFVSGQVLTAAELNAAGTFADYTPTWTQSATITKTVNWARYSQFNKIVVGSIKMTATGAGTANNKVVVSLPVTASSNNFVIGSMAYFDTGATVPYWTSPALHAFYESSTTMAFSAAYVSGSSSTSPIVPTTDVKFGQNFNGLTAITVASGDIIYIQFMYEAA